MRRRRLAGRVLAGGVVIGVGLVTSGCSLKGGDNANVIEGKRAFVAKCGSCHTLARANTKGIVGPNLDEAFRASVREGLERSTIRSVVEGQVAYPNKAGVMPKGLASGATLRDIAAYVAEVAARPGKDTGLLATAVESASSSKPAVESAGKLEIDASPSGQLAYTASKATATPGAVTITMANMSGVSHNIATGSGPVLGASSFTAKGSVSVNVTLKPGTYTYFCEAPGHRAAGMYGTITVK
jgi:plastocyanin